MKGSEVEKEMYKSEEWLREESKKRGLKFIEYKHIAVGYLDITEEYQKGIVSQNFINKLKQIWDEGLSLMAMGHHTCEFCGNSTSSSEKILKDEKNRVQYKFPQIIFHYIEKHDYQPPEDFILFILTTENHGKVHQGGKDGK